MLGKSYEPPIFKCGLSIYENGIPYRRDLEPGLFRVDHDDGERATLSFTCPCGCKRVNQVSIYRGEKGYGWKWNGNKEKPTLRPSLQLIEGCKWHGYITDGVWKVA